MNSVADNSNNAEYLNCPACSGSNQRVAVNASNVYTRHFFDQQNVVADYHAGLSIFDALARQIPRGEGFSLEKRGLARQMPGGYYAYGEDYGTPTEGISNRYKFALPEGPPGGGLSCYSGKAAKPRITSRE